MPGPRTMLAPLLLALAPVSGCQCGAGDVPAPPDAASAAAPATAAPSASAAPAERAAEAPPPPLRFVGASQILVSFKGAELAAPSVTRTKEQAKARAEEVLAKLKDGGSFEELAKSHSDDATKVIGGAIGNFERSAMPPAFADAAFALAVGETSGVVETARGFHIIRRTR